MSIPITDCMISRACDSEEGYKKLLDSVIYNMSQLAYSRLPCPCEKKHTFTPEQASQLSNRINEDVSKYRTELREKIEVDRKRRDGVGDA